MSQPLVAIIYNTAHYAFMMRRVLIAALQDHGFRVAVLAPADKYVPRLVEMDVEFIDVPMRMNKNPLTDVLLTLNLRKKLSRLQPFAVLGYTAKPNIFGGLAARSLGIPMINNIAGLGSVFDAGGILSQIIKQLYRLSLANSAMVFFQNPDDQRLFLKEGIMAHQRHDVLPGSGVDLKAFIPPNENVERKKDAPFRFLLSARLIREKGIPEYVVAARQLRESGQFIECWLLGHLGVDNPSAISETKVRQWQAEGVIVYMGSVEDVRPVLAQVDCVVLPSYYREGVPRVLLEAAAMGLPIITTDAVGCREAVDEGLTGFLCRPQDAQDLARCMRQMMKTPRSDRIAMGQRGRAKMQCEFDERIVIDRYVQTITSLITGEPKP